MTTRLPQTTETKGDFPSLARHPGDHWLAAPQRFDRPTERALRGVIRALLPPPPAPRPADIEDRLVAHMGMMLQYQLPAAALGMRVLLHILEHSPRWRLHSAQTLSDLDPARGSAVLEGLSSSRLLTLRMLTLPVKAILLSGYFDQDEVHAAMDYAPRPFMHSRMDAHRRMQEARTKGTEEVEP